jgi:crotonobetainyl-CoA:carnitine CoA-transferase CaiB-like acyl-CoA transferase
MSRTDTPGGPLSGHLVVDLSRALAGPHAGMMLADLGARVIKVENPGTGDDTRGWGPPFVGPADDPQATYFLSCNRNKESISPGPEERRRAGGAARPAGTRRRRDRKLPPRRAGPARLLDRGHARAEPAVVILSITGFGHDGPESRGSGYDQILQGEAGLMSLTGSGPDDPQRVGVPIADLLSGMNGAFGTLAALLEREQTGQRQVVRTSLLASLIGVHAFQGTRTTVAGEVPEAQGNHHPSIAPYGLFHCKDGSVQISVGSEKLWSAFAAAFGLDPAASGVCQQRRKRVRNRAAVIEEVERVFADYGAAELLAKLNDAGIPAGKVRSLDEVYAWEQVASQGLVDGCATIRSSARSACPGPPLRFFSPRGHRGNHRQEHTRRRCWTRTGRPDPEWLGLSTVAAGGRP